MSSPVAFLLSFSFEFMFNLNFKIDFLKFGEVSARLRRSFDASGGACARGVKRPRVGVLTRCVFAFVFV